jgi:hypothetical protein
LYLKGKNRTEIKIKLAVNKYGKVFRGSALIFVTMQNVATNAMDKHLEKEWRDDRYMINQWLKHAMWDI